MLKRRAWIFLLRVARKRKMEVGSFRQKLILSKGGRPTVCSGGGDDRREDRDLPLRRFARFHSDLIPRERFQKAVRELREMDVDVRPEYGACGRPAELLASREARHILKDSSAPVDGLALARPGEGIPGVARERRHSGCGVRRGTRARGRRFDAAALSTGRNPQPPSWRASSDGSHDHDAETKSGRAARRHQ